MDWKSEVYSKEMMFGRKPRADTIYNQLKMLNGYNAVFTTWGNDPYSTDVVRSGAVDAIAKERQPSSNPNI